ncbi:MAG TPA: STAS domain-containing protein, partial [Gemmatales bacterium]|nr:STAS domain-containing protein [Gemmatales bacterium]
VCDHILERVRSKADGAQLVVLDLSATPSVDLQSSQTLAMMIDELIKTGVRVLAVEVRSSVRDRLRSEGLDEKLGGISRGMSVAQAVAEFQKQHV